MTDCARARVLVEKLLDGEATPAENLEARSHLEACPGCGAHMEFLTSIGEEARAMSISEPPESYWERLPGKVLARIDSESSRPSGWWSLLPPPSVMRWGALAASLALVMAVGVSVLREERRRPAVSPPPASVPVAPGEAVTEASKADIQLAAEPSAAPPMARDEAEPAKAELGSSPKAEEPARAAPNSRPLDRPAPADVAAASEAENVVPASPKESVRLVGGARRPQAAPAALSSAAVEDCDALRQAVSAVGATSAEMERSHGADARFRLAVCSLERYEGQPTDEHRIQAIEDAQAFLARESEGERAELVREKLNRIQP